MKRALKFFLIIMFMFTCQAESLWKGENVGLFNDHIAKKVGDSLTVIVEEYVKNTQSSGSTIKNASSISFGPGTGYAGFVDSATGIPNKSSFEAEGKQNTLGEFKAEVTVRVIEVLENRELVVEGSKVVNINNDKQYLYVKGIVRPENISKGNMVSSRYLANSQIDFKRDGEINNVNDPGLVTKIFNMIF
ncbi:MAG: flagellar basal body L-ring protein FlgH [Candidatus Margulisbacteria bacterium]|nr:flagellar basal body L-ring protein FlgH [Candidatus Margulisiibacteriota bacterium]